MIEEAKKIVDEFEIWCRDAQIENTFCTYAKRKLAEMISERVDALLPSDETIMKESYGYGHEGSKLFELGVSWLRNRLQGVGDV